MLMIKGYIYLVHNNVLDDNILETGTSQMVNLHDSVLMWSHTKFTLTTIPLYCATPIQEMSSVSWRASAGGNVVPQGPWK